MIKDKHVKCFFLPLSPLPKKKKKCYFTILPLSTSEAILNISQRKPNKTKTNYLPPFKLFPFILNEKSESGSGPLWSERASDRKGESEVYTCWHFRPDVYVSLEPDACV